MLDFELKRVSDHEENKIEQEEIPDDFAQRFVDEGGFDNYMDQVRLQSQKFIELKNNFEKKKKKKKTTFLKRYSFRQ